MPLNPIQLIFYQVITYNFVIVEHSSTTQQLLLVVLTVHLYVWRQMLIGGGGWSLLCVYVYYLLSFQLYVFVGNVVSLLLSVCDVFKQVQNCDLHWLNIW